VGNHKKWIVRGILAFVAIFVVLVPLISYGNLEVEARAGVEASKLSNQVVYDRVWKTLSQQGGVAEKYQKSFREIYVDIMKAENPEGQAKLAKFVKQANPNFDSSLFKTLMTSIEANRRDFEREQKGLIDRGREHDLLLQKFPSSIYLSILGRKHINIQMVTSSRTEDAFKSGKDDNTDLFGGGH